VPTSGADSITARVLCLLAIFIMQLWGQLAFGNVPAGATVTSTVTFAIRHNRRYPMDWSAVSWDILPLIGRPGIYYKYDELGRITKIQRIPSQ
jgi:hypothetical protein